MIDDGTLKWMLEQTDEKLVDVLFSAGRIPYAEKDYWLELMPALRAARPEARSHVPIKVRPMLVSGMLAKDDRGPVILLDSEQEPEQQVLAFWHEVLHLVGLKDEVRTEETAMILAGACPSILRAVCDNINVPDSGLGMNIGPEKHG